MICTVFKLSFRVCSTLVKGPITVLCSTYAKQINLGLSDIKGNVYVGGCVCVWGVFVYMGVFMYKFLHGEYVLCIHRVSYILYIIYIYNIIVLSVKAILIIIHQNIHSDSPPPFIFLGGGNTAHIMYCQSLLIRRYVCTSAPQQAPTDKAERIHTIWKAGRGVVSIHCFHNISHEEAHTREACMIDAMGM